MAGLWTGSNSGAYQNFSLKKILLYALKPLLWLLVVTTISVYFAFTTINSFHVLKIKKVLTKKK